MEQVTPVTTVTRSGIPWTIAAVWGVALLAIALVGALASSPANSASGTPGSQPVQAAAASGDPSASPKASDAAGQGRLFAAPAGIGIGPGGKGGHRIGGRISVTAITGSQLSLRTDSGWSRTIDASGATITRDGAAITLADLQVGDQIAFRETRQADGTSIVTAIAVLAPTVTGTISAVDASSVTVRLPDGTTRTIQTTAATTYQLNRAAATRADLVVGHVIHAAGAVSGSTFTATAIQIAPATLVGTVTAKTADTITITDQAGASKVIRVTATTTYRIAGDDTPSLDDIAVGDRVGAQGTLNTDGSITATIVAEGSLKGGPDGFGGKGGRGGHRGPGAGADGANPNATPAPSASASATS